MPVRELAKPYLETAISLFHSRGLSRIVEIGSMRQPLEHPLDEIDRRCCLDGHSSVFFAGATDDFTTVDIDFWTSVNAGAAIKHTLGKTADVLCRDGIEFLRENDGAIDLLYLDAWDVFLTDSAERHLEAFQAAEEDLHERSIVLIDDTDMDFDGSELVLITDRAAGKGRLLVPYMESCGWTALFGGRQTLLVRAFAPAEAEQVQAELHSRRSATRAVDEKKYPEYYSLG
ncbi:MAG TPA: hypothetical protein VL501_01030 [Pyrinomonadaceae bacterium]|nr:hypothetical protein [Pyrinomonadaceae bacterium]